MYLKTEHGLQLDDGKLTENQEQQVLQSKNAMSAFLYDTFNLPPSTYLRVYDDHVFIGAVHLEQNPFNNIVTIHPMLIERDRALFTEVTEAAILWCLNNHMTPTAKVLDDPAYSYMHKFLENLGMATSAEKSWRVYMLPRGWKPISFTTYTMEFA